MQLTHGETLTSSSNSAMPQLSDAAIEEKAEPKFPDSIKHPNVEFAKPFFDGRFDRFHIPGPVVLFALYFNCLP
jgi:hypothetical protein